MADLNEIQAAQSIKIIGADATATETTPVNATNTGNLLTADIINAGTGVQGAVTVSTTAVEVKVGVSRLANRKSLTAHNNSSATLYWGYTSGVTVANGTPLFKDQFISWDVGEDQPIFMIAGSGSNNVRVTEGA